VKALCLLIAAVAPILAQEPQAAPPSIQLRQPDLNFRDFKLPGRPNPFVMTNPVKFKPALRMEAFAAPPQTCAIPLLQVTPKGNYTMKMMKPAEPVPNMPDVKVPAPACKDWNR
jgi:hypothetical protein